MTDQVCADRMDCAAGERCNTALSPPRCQAVLCGPEGSACSESALCREGLTCADESCVVDLCLIVEEIYSDALDELRAPHTDCQSASVGCKT